MKAVALAAVLTIALITVAFSVALPCDSALPCGDCLASADCGFCKVGTGGACKPKVAPNGTEDLEEFCTRESGSIVTSCPVVAAACDVALPCADCQAKAECGYCRIGDLGKCYPVAELAATCEAKAGTVISKDGDQCPAPVTKPPPTPYCEKTSNCDVCTSNPAGCGYCVLDKGYSAKCSPLADNITGLCESWGGTVYTSANSDTCPPPPPCAYSDCSSCIADSTCGSCTWADRTNGRVYSKCVPKEIPEGLWLPNVTKYCGEVKGVIAGLTCPIVPPLFECVQKDCASCTRDTNCAFCTGTYEGKTWGVCKPATLAEGFCSKETGTLYSTQSTCPAVETPTPTNVEVVDKVNSAEFTEAALNQEINKDAALGNLVVIVTAVTKAEALGENKGKFDALLDVSGSDASEEEKGKVCGSLKKVVSSVLGLKSEGVGCEITLKNTQQKRSVSSYAAGLTVDGSQTASSSRIVVSVTLAVVALVALVLA